VNLIGEHTDYNEGFVAPFALGMRVAAAGRARSDGLLRVTTVGSDGHAHTAPDFPIATLAPGSATATGWCGYPAGVAWALRREGLLPAGSGAELVIAADLPAGAGLSSSAALEVATALALLELAGHTVGGVGGPAPASVAALARRAENEFVGVPSGGLDQTASLCATAGNVFFLDVRSGSAEQVPFGGAEDAPAILVIDTGVHRSLAATDYGARRAGCARAVGLLGVSALREVGPGDLPRVLPALPGELRGLVRHVVTENARVLEVAELLRRGRPTEIGDALTASHESLRGDYRVSCAELDAAVSAANGAGAYGARMTGAGFGGSAIALVPAAARDEVTAAVRAAFACHGFATPRVLPAVPSAGAGRDMRL
jgi:galactokinase